MPKVQIFGGLFKVDPNVQYDIGEAKLKLALISGSALKVELNGDVGSLRFGAFRATFDCTVSGQVVKLSDGDGVWSGTVDFVFAGAVVSAALTKVTAPAPTPAFGVAFETALIAPVRSALTTSGRGILKDHTEWMLNWTSHLLSVDVLGGVTQVWPQGGAPSLLWSDRFGKPADDKVRQQFDVAGLRLAPTSFQLIYQPKANAIFLGPDVLDPTRAMDGATNAFLFQHIAAEAHLTATFTYAASSWSNGGWSITPALRGGMIRLAAPVLKDEHGHPVIFSVATALPLDRRRGFTKPTATPSGETNEAIVIGDYGASTSVTALMEAVDPVEVYGLSRKAKPLANQRLQSPYWVKGDRVPLQEQRPREIMGLTRDAVLILDAPTRSQADVRARPPINVTLTFAPIFDAHRGLRFVLPTVEIPLDAGAAPATLSFELPEQATLLRQADQSLSLDIVRREAKARAKSVRLPLLDSRWALSDIGPSAIPGDGLAEMGARWLKELDEDARRAFEHPEAASYEHVSGLRVDPTVIPLQRLIAPAPATSRGSGGSTDEQKIGLVPTVFAARPPQITLASALSTSSWRASGPPAPFLLGGPHGLQPFTGETPIEAAAKAMQDGRLKLQDKLEDFFWFWLGRPRGTLPPEPEWREARLALWDYLVGLRPKLPDPEDWTFEDLVVASERLQAARDALSRNPPNVLGFDGFEELLEDALPDEVAELLDPDRAAGDLPMLLQYAYAPPTMELARRALEAIGSKTLKNYKASLERFVTDDLSEWIDDYFRGAKGPKGFLAQLVQGLPPVFEQVQGIWAERETYAGKAREVLLELAESYGADFTSDVYANILESESDSEALLDVLRDFFNFPLKRLADLAGEPPDYLVVSRRLRRPAAGDPHGDPNRLHVVDDAAALWNHRFDFCVFGGGKAWDMLLDDQTTVIVKLGGKRGLANILTEATKAYRAPGRPDPFGLDPLRPGDPLPAFKALLPAELLQPDWRGALIINPKIDLERDPMLSTLCGFTHISARFAAVGGRGPEPGFPANLSISGRIEQLADATGWVDPSGKPQPEPKWGGADVAWSLIRFAATVKNTTILTGDISFRLNVRELFGRRRDWQEIIVSGTLPQTTGSSGGKPRDFTFAATFSNPLPLEVDVAFLDTVKLRGIRVGSHDSDTTLDIDADLICQDWSIGPIELDAPEKLKLSDFRIRIPEVEGGRAVAMGILRSLSFDLGGIRFPVAEPRRLTIAGLDIRPVGVGLLRGDRNAIVSQLLKETVPLSKPTFPEPNGARYAYPYLDTQIEFGRTPALGGAGQFSLVSRVGVPVLASDDPSQMPRFGDPGIGLASLTGRDLKISLFRLITLEFSQIYAGVFDLQNSKQAGAIWAEGFNLSLLSWSLFNKSDDPKARVLVYAHDTSDADTRGFLAWYAAPSTDPDSFFQLQWLLVAQNIDPGKTLKDGLLNLTGSDLNAEMKALSGLKPKDDPTKLNFALEKKSGWLAGVRFKLGDFFNPCALIFHDGYYYGIRLGGLLAKLITGEDDISLAYIPGADPSLDRFRVVLRIAALDMLAVMESGEIALEWNPAWDFLIDLGQPWRGPNGYMWERAFSIPMGVFEAKFGFFIEKRTSLQPPDNLPVEPGTQYMTLSAGAGFYFGYFFGTPRGIAWVRAGIGVFGVLIGSATLRVPRDVGSNPLALLKSSLAKLSVTGVLGIYAYGEGGVEVWILSARFRVSAQAFVEVNLVYIPNARSYLAYNATLAAHYSASVRVGSGIFSWTFSVSGAVQMQISGSAAFG